MGPQVLMLAKQLHGTQSFIPYKFASKNLQKCPTRGKNANICTMVKASMELWGWLVGISSTHRYCTSKIVVKQKKTFPRNSIKQKKAVCSDSLVLMPLRLTHEVPDVWAQTFGPKPLDLLGPRWPKSPRSILGQVSEVLVHLPEANGVTKAIGATHQQHRELLCALRQLPGANRVVRRAPQGIPRNPWGNPGLRRKR